MNSTERDGSFSVFRMLGFGKQSDEQTVLANSLQMKMGFATHVGMRRQLNEDSIVAFHVALGYQSEVRKRALLLVADGMGGHNKGEVASLKGAEAIADQLQKLLLKEKHIPEAEYHYELSNAFSLANKRILDLSKTSTEYEGMGTTIALAIIDGRRLIVAWAGDSRVYLISGKQGREVSTEDDSYVQELVREGKISREEARTHPQRNVITKVVGYYSEITPEMRFGSLEPDDVVLVCSDGLTSHVDDEEIRELVLANADPQKACDELVKLANSRGGADNISVVICPAGMVDLPVENLDPADRRTANPI
jgi:protein phosphatase